MSIWLLFFTLLMWYITLIDLQIFFFFVALFITTKIWIQPKYPSTDIYNGIFYSAIKKKEIKQFAAFWMDLEIVILCEVSQTEKEKYCMTSFKFSI